MPTEYFSSLKKADQKKIESVLPASVQKGKTLYRRTDKNGVMSYFQLPASIVMKNDLNFKYEKCKSIADEKEFLSKTLYGDYTTADKKIVAAEQKTESKTEKPDK